MAFRIVVIPATPVGGAGVAGVTVRAGVPACKIHGYGIKYTSQPATTDLTVTMKGKAADKTLIARTNVNTSVAMKPTAEQAVDSAGTVIAATFVPIISDGGNVEVVVAQGDPVENGVIVTLMIEV